MCREEARRLREGGGVGVGSVDDDMDTDVAGAGTGAAGGVRASGMVAKEVANRQVREGVTCE